MIHLNYELNEEEKKRQRAEIERELQEAIDELAAVSEQVEELAKRSQKVMRELSEEHELVGGLLRAAQAKAERLAQRYESFRFS